MAGRQMRYRPRTRHASFGDLTFVRPVHIEREIPPRPESRGSSGRAVSLPKVSLIERYHPDGTAKDGEA